MSADRLHVKVITPWPPFKFESDRCLMSTEADMAQSDALLCVFHPAPELLSFPGRRAFYNCEPMSTRDLGVRALQETKAVVENLTSDEWLWHGHTDVSLRVPHVTHRSLTSAGSNGQRMARVIAVVSNSGPSVALRSQTVHERNAFASARSVDLYGSVKAWSWYRRTYFSFRGPPRSFRGEIPGGWGEQSKIDAMARYHAALCLENSQEAFYFTEKFIDVVRAGCVPIYRAHPTVRQTFLSGAQWIDPVDFGGSVRQTLKAALAADRVAVAENNWGWVQRLEVQATRESSIYARIADILQRTTIPRRPKTELR